MLWRMLFKGLRAIHGPFVAVSPIFRAIHKTFVAIFPGFRAIQRPFVAISLGRWYHGK